MALKNVFANGSSSGANTGSFPDSITPASFSNGTSLQPRLMDSNGYKLRANYAAFVSLLKLMGMKAAAKAMGRNGFAAQSKTVNCDNPKFEWFEQDYGSPKTTLASNVTADSTSITVASGDGVMFKKGDLVYIAPTKEMLRVESIAGDVLTVRSIAQQATTVGHIKNAANSGDTVILVSSAYGEGSFAADPIHYSAEQQFNYCQIFKKSTKITNTNAVTKSYGRITDLGEQKKILFDQFLLEKSRAYFLGQRSSGLDTIANNGGELLRTTNGLESFVATNRHVSSSLTYDKFMEFAKAAYEYGGDEKILICNPAFMVALNKAIKGDSNNNYELSPKAKEYGINIRRILTCAGDMDLVVDRTMGEIYSLPTAFALEMSLIEEMVLRADKWEENIQQAGWDFRMDQIICESGLKVVLEKRHARWEIDPSIGGSATI